MEKATNGQFREFVGKLLTKGSDDAIALIDKTKIQNAINSLSSSCDDVFSNFVSFINNDCQLNTTLVNAFVVGEVFRHQAERGDHRLWLSENTKNLLIKPNLEKVISINTDLGKLSKYSLPKNMNDSSIQSNTGNPGLISEETFLLIMFLLIFQPVLAQQLLSFVLQKDKYYIFHVMVGNKKMAFNVSWDDAEWSFGAYGFDDDYDWLGGYVFVSFATKARA